MPAAQHEVEAAQREGVLESIEVKEGDMVKAGTVVALFDQNAIRMSKLDLMRRWPGSWMGDHS